MSRATFEMDEQLTEMVREAQKSARADLEAAIVKITKERDCWYEQAEMLQHQNDKAFDELHKHIEELEATVKEQAAEIERLSERRCEICGYAEHHREHTRCLRQQLAASQAKDRSR